MQKVLITGIILYDLGPVALMSHKLK